MIGLGEVKIMNFLKGTDRFEIILMLVTDEILKMII